MQYFLYALFTVGVIALLAYRIRRVKSKHADSVPITPTAPQEDSVPVDLEDYQTFLDGRGKLPSTLELAKNPFLAYLENFAPDGLADYSGVSCWLKPAQGVAWADALRDCMQWQETHLAYYRSSKKFLYPTYCTDRIVILLDEGNLPEEPFWNPLIRLAVVRSENVLYDICDQKEYHIRTAEYPGSVDDAATYGQWYLY